MTDDIKRWNNTIEAELFLAEERSYIEETCSGHARLAFAVVWAVLKDYFCCKEGTNKYESAETFLFSRSKEQRMLRDFWFECADLSVERVMYVIHNADRLPPEEREALKNNFISPKSKRRRALNPEGGNKWAEELWWTQ